MEEARSRARRRNARNCYTAVSDLLTRVVVGRFTGRLVARARLSRFRLQLPAGRIVHRDGIRKRNYVSRKYSLIIPLSAPENDIAFSLCLSLYINFREIIYLPREEIRAALCFSLLPSRMCVRVCEGGKG